MAAPTDHKTRSAAERLAVRAEIARRYRAGETQTAIGAALGLTQQAVSYYVKGLLSEWRTQMGADLDAKLQQELAKLDWLEQEAAAEYERSKKPLKKRQVVNEEVAIQNGDMELTTTPGKAIKTTETVEERLGDTRYLDIIDRCIDRRLRIFGLYAQGESQATVVVKAYSGVDVEQV